MKTTFKLGNVEFNGVKLNDIELSQEYSATEAITMLNEGKSFLKSLLKEMPEMMQDLETAFNKFNEIDERVNISQKQEEKIVESKSRIDKLIEELEALGNAVLKNTISKQNAVLAINRITEEMQYFILLDERPEILSLINRVTYTINM